MLKPLIRSSLPNNQIRICRGDKEVIRQGLQRTLKIEQIFDIMAVQWYYNYRESATDRRLALIKLMIKNNRQVFTGQGGYFCVLLLRPSE